MADTTGRITYSVTMIPEELITQLASQRGSNWSDIYTKSTEIGASSGEGTTESLTILDSGDSNDGYLNKAPFYAQITTSSTAAITGLTNVEFVYFKHTGYEFSSTSELSGLANTADHLEVRMDSAAGAVIAVIPPGGAIALPVQSSTGWSTVADRRDSGDYYFQSIDPDDLDTAGGNTIAMEFVAVVAN